MAACTIKMKLLRITPPISCESYSAARSMQLEGRFIMFGKPLNWSSAQHAFGELHSYGQICFLILLFLPEEETKIEGHELL